MKSSIQLSIITPCYNAKKFIGGCIQNVIDQSVDKVEHIIMDAASQDGTQEIVQSYLNKYSHIRLFSEKDSGQSNAMNKGIQHAQAEWIGFLNVDDFYSKKTLGRILRYIQESKKPTLLLGDCQMLGDKDQIIGINKPKALNLYKLIAGFEAPYNPSSYFYTKKIHDIVGLYNEQDHYTMDLDFLLRAYPFLNIQYYQETWGNFRFIKGSKTFDDIQSGNTFKRCDELKENTYQKLSLFKKGYVRFYRFENRLLKFIQRRI